MMDALPSMLLWMFVMGFMGSLHCVGMCGGLISAISISTKKTWWSGLLVYQLGRISTYAMLGLTLGFTGLVLHDFGGDFIQRLITTLAGSFYYPAVWSTLRLLWVLRQGTPSMPV